jgi:hypothetical protein
MESIIGPLSACICFPASISATYKLGIVFPNVCPLSVVVLDVSRDPSIPVFSVISVLRYYRIHMFLTLMTLKGAKCSDKASGWTTGFRFLTGAGNLSPHHCVQTGCGGHQPPIQRALALFPLGKAVG